MTGILTNTTAMSSLQALSATQLQLSKTQAQVSSGLAVADPSDNAAYWSINQAMSAQISGLTAVNQGLSLTKSIADVTAAALVAIKGSLDKIQNDVVAARQSGIDKSALQADISAQQQLIITVANGANFNGVNWLVNTLSSSLNVTSTIDIDVLRPEFNAVLLGQDPDHSSHLTSQQVETTTVIENGVAGSQTDTFGYDITTTDAHDGTPTTQSVRSPDVITGSADFSVFGNVSLPMSVSASGLLRSTFSLTPLTLFTDFTGGYSEQQTVTAGGIPDPEDSSGPYTSSGSSRSYDGYGGGAASGILDPIVLTTTGSSTVPSSSPASPSGPSQTQVGLSVSGGSIYTTTPSSGGGGAGATAPVIQESILDLNIVDTSADDLTVIERAVQTAIAGIINASTVVGALQTQASAQQTFNSALVDSLTSGVGSLVDADMNVASTRLQALKTQQQLGIQALSIANENTELVLKLFRQ